MEMTSKCKLCSVRFHHLISLSFDTEAINSQVEHSLAAANGRVSSPEASELLKHPSMGSISGILGLGGLLHCSETYSRKVFVGGLPPEVDEGTS